MPEKFEVFQSFNDEALALTVAETLKGNNIEFVLDKSKTLLDTSFVDTSISRNIHIRLKPEDFPKANQVLDNYYKSQLNDIDPDYYLFSFSNDELLEIISKQDEWGHLDLQLAQKLLKERGVDINDGQVLKLWDERINALAQPEKAGWFTIFFGYCFIPFGLIISFLIGRHLFYSKRTLPNGVAVYTYRNSDRKHGDRIMIIAGVAFIVSALLWIVVYINK